MTLATKEWVSDFVKKVLKKGNDENFFSSGMDHETIAEKAQVSTTSVYHTAYFDVNPFGNYEYICAYLTVPDAYGSTVYKACRNIVGLTSLSFQISTDTASGSFTINLGSNYVNCSSYRGSGYNVYITIEAYRTPAYKLMMDEYNTHVE